MNVNSGIKISHVNSVLGDNKDRYQYGLRIAAGVVSAAAAVIHAIAMPALSLYFFPRTNLSPVSTPLQVIEANKASIFVMVNSIVFGAASSVGTGFLTYRLIDKHIVQRKVDQFAKDVLGFTDSYEPESVVDLRYIRSLIQKADKTAQSQLLAHMNFFQLKEARKFISEKAFASAIGDNRDLVWTYALDALKHCHNPEDLAQKMEDFRVMYSETFFKIYISALRDLYESNPAFLKVFRDKESFVYEPSEESKLLNRKLNSESWDLLWHRSVRLQSEAMKIKLNNDAVEQFKEALKNPDDPYSAYLWIARVLVSGNLADFDIGIDSQNFQLAFTIGESLRKHYNEDTLYNSATAFCATHLQLAKDHLNTGHEHLSKALLNILFPSNGSKSERGLNINEVHQIIKEYKNRLARNAEILHEILAQAFGLVMVLALVVGIEIYMLSISHLILFYPFFILFTGLGVAAVLGELYGIVIIPIADLAAARISSYFFSKYCIWKFARVEEAIRARNGTDFISYGTDITALLNAVDKTAKSELISKMNFQQLRAAYICVGEAAFVDFIKEVKSEEAALWRDVLWIKNSNSTPQQLEKMLRLRGSIIKERPEVWAQLRNFFVYKPEHSSVLYDNFREISSSEPAERVIKIRSGEKSKEYDAQTLFPKSDFLRARRSCKDLVMPDDTDETVFRYFDFLAGNLTIQSKQDVFELLPHAHYFSDTRTRDMLGSILMLYESEVSDEEHEEIVSEFYPKDTRYYEFVQKRMNASNERLNASA
jgi:hypothetical protein